MDMQWWGIPAAALIVGVVELLKHAGFPARWAGILAAVVGVLGGLAAHVWANSPAVAAAVNGLVVGLAAAGMWSSLKNAAEALRERGPQDGGDLGDV